VGFELGGEAGERVAQHFRVPVSSDTLLRIIRSTCIELSSTPRVLGVDDWAKRKGHSYGTLLVDLERNQPVDLLPDREAKTLATWLQTHPGVEVITRDRANVYIDGATTGAPDAIQIADRWHLLKNLGETLQRMLETHPVDLRVAAKLAHGRSRVKEMPATPTIASAMAPTTPTKTPPSRRQKLFDEVMALNEQGHSRRAIARQLNLNPRTVARYIDAGELPRRLAPQNTSTVMPYRAHIERRWQEGCHNGRQLWREIQADGYGGSYSSVRRFLKRFHPDDGRKHQASNGSAPRSLSARQAMRLLVQMPEDATDEQHLRREMLCLCCAQAAEAYPLAQRFVKMFKERQVDALDPWLEDAQASSISQLRNFAASLMRDYDAVKAALVYEWSNGQVEGQVNRLKTIKRQMYGRAKFDLLRQRVLYDDT
jgi:transposase